MTSVLSSNDEQLRAHLVNGELFDGKVRHKHSHR